MNRLTYIIDLIDTEVAAKLAYKDVSASGIVRREPKAGQTIIYKYKGEAIVFNDVPGISTYHRVIDVSEVRNLDSGYGSELLKEQTYRMRYVMYGDQTRVNDICDDYNYQLADEVGGFIPNTFSSVNTAAIEAKSVVINISRTDYDRVRVFRDELPDNEFNLSDTDILFAIEYDLTIRYLAQCTTVDCDPVYPVVTITDGAQTVELRAPNAYTCSTDCADGTVNITNSLGTTLYSKEVASGGTATQQVADQTAQGTTGAGTITFPANTTGTIPDVDYTDSDGSAASVPYGTSLVCTPSKDLADYTCGELNSGLTRAQKELLQGIYPLKTGQTFSVVAGDDGDLQNGRPEPAFQTLGCDNSARFVQYSANIIWDKETDLIWTASLQSAALFANQITNADTAVIDGITNWLLPNKADYESVLAYKEKPLVNGAWNIDQGNSNINLMTSTTLQNLGLSYFSIRIIRTGGGGHYEYRDGVISTTPLETLYCRKRPI